MRPKNYFHKGMKDMAQADIGLIGLAVMGQNLVLNMNDHGYKVVVFNRTQEKTDEFLQGPAKETNILGSKDLKEFFSALKRPRRVILMVKAGEAVDAFIEMSLPYLDKGDIIIDGGNSHFMDSQRRCESLASQGILFVGAGISGGEEGARKGPSIMPGGNPDAWPHIKEIFQAIAAKVDGGQPCCEWVGGAGSGHYVKMVHNGIEYGDMQLIGEAYYLMKQGLGIENADMAPIFAKWNTRELESYLIEITAEILRFEDQDGSSLLDKILDVTKQKGTGRWASINAMELGMPLTLINEAVASRNLSSMKEERQAAASLFPETSEKFEGDREAFVESIGQALYAAKIISYAQGFMLMRRAAKEFDWNLNFGAIANMWRGGCIIRSAFLKMINKAYERTPDLTSLMVDDYFKRELIDCQGGWRQVVAEGARLGLATPALSSGLSFFDGYRSSYLPANLLAAQRDYFGAHTYQRTDKPKGEFFHTNWTGASETVSSSSYSA
jgi:6-phosphogluconate dehydrogenase